MYTYYTHLIIYYEIPNLIKVLVNKICTLLVNNNNKNKQWTESSLFQILHLVNFDKILQSLAWPLPVIEKKQT